MVDSSPIYYPTAHANVLYVPRSLTDAAASGPVPGLSLLGVPMRDAEVRHNDVFTADEFSITVDGHHFPSDPRDIRALGVDLYIGDSGRPGKNLGVASDPHRVLVGNADEIERTYRDQTLHVMMKGRDLTGLLLDAQWGDRVVQLNRPLEDIVREVLAELPGLDRLRVEATEAFVVPGDPGSKRRNTYRASADSTVFKGLAQLALRAGALLVLHGDTLRIESPRTVDGSQADPPVFIEGRNLTNLRIHRELGRSDIPNVRVRAFDTKTGKTVIGQWPESPKKTVKAAKGSAGEEVEWLDQVIQHPAPTKQLLSDVARRIRTQLAYQQLAISFETQDMVTMSNEDRPVPVTTIRNGTSVRIFIDDDTRIILERAMTPYQKALQLQREGFDAQVADALARGIRTIDALLFVDTAQHRYSADDGYTLAVEAVTAIDGGDRA